MKILHTSDWHLGRSLYGRKRYEEFSAFLDWLLKTIEEQKVDALLVAGDIFDTSTPGNKAQELYYRFLCRVSSSCCRHVVVIAGNHDSPSFLNAPGQLLRALNVYVIGAVTENIEDELIVLNNNNNKPEAIICAVPYLRDKDIRTVEPGESIDHKNAKMVEGVKNHYINICSIAEQKQAAIKSAGHDNVPIIAMGHLFTAGGRTVDGDGVRDLYVGSLAHVEADIFPPSIDYLALGHLHVPQIVGGFEHIRYSGSPIPMGYGEASQQKKVVIVNFNGKDKEIEELAVPSFQKLIRITGTLNEIIQKIGDLKKQNSSAWLEIEYNGSEIISGLREMIDEEIAGTSIEIRRIKNLRILNKFMKTTDENENLEELGVAEVFNRCLDAHDVSNDERQGLINSYNEIVKSLIEDD